MVELARRFKRNWGGGVHLPVAWAAVVSRARLWHRLWMGIARFDTLPTDQPVLLAGPTASGKSGLALRIAASQGRCVVNADALQVFAGWRVLTARPGPADLARAPHALYGHVPIDGTYSVGDWLRDVAPYLAEQPAPVIVGGTGLYFMALTEGLAEIPPVSAKVRALSDRRLAVDGPDALAAELDADTLARIDTANPVRIQRAWEVQSQTGRGLAAWHAETPPPLLPLSRAVPLVIDADPGWLDTRIVSRFAAMLDAGALAEARAMPSNWSSNWPSSKAIGAAEVMALARGAITHSEAVARATLATRRYAKRQRTWARRRMRHWQAITT